MKIVEGKNSGGEEKKRRQKGREKIAASYTWETSSGALLR